MGTYSKRESMTALCEKEHQGAGAQCLVSRDKS